MNALMSTFHSCYLRPVGGCGRVLVMMCPWGARHIWKFFACPDTLLIAPSWNTAASFYVLFCFAAVEPHSKHVFQLSA